MRRWRLKSSRNRRDDRIPQIGSHICEPNLPVAANWSLLRAVRRDGNCIQTTGEQAQIQASDEPIFAGETAREKA